MSDPANDEISPFNDDLTDEQLKKLKLPDQIRHAVYLDNHRAPDIAEHTTFSTEWTREVANDMVDDGDLKREEKSDGNRYHLPADALPDEPAIDTETDADADVDEPETTDAPDASDAADDDPDEAMASAKPMTAADATVVDDTDHLPEWYRELKKLEAEGELAEPLPAWDDIQSSRAEHGGQLPVDRDYDWTEETLDPERVNEFISADGEFEDIMRELRDRHATGKVPHWTLTGPTGCGKTSAAENAALELERETDVPVPTFEINCHDGLRPGFIMGQPTYIGEETWWQDGPGVKALLASQRGPTVLILDEVNRAPARALGVLMSLLDHQCSLTLNARGGERVEGDPMNLIVFATMNEGAGYVVNKMDTAFVRRLGNNVPVDYIGMNSVRKEAELIADRTPVGLSLAKEMVETANDIREQAKGESAVSMGVPTVTMFDWARTAYSHRDTDADGGPVVKAAYYSVINPFFRGDETEHDIVTTAIEDGLKGMPVEEGEVRESLTEEAVSVGDDVWLMCEDCGWYSSSSDADATVVSSMLCPECDSTLTTKEDV